MDELTVTSDHPWWSWRRWVYAVADAAGVVQRELAEAPPLGAEYAPGSVAEPGYDALSSMSALAAFPWVYAAILRSSGDLAGRKLRVVQGRGKTAKVLDDHPLYDLLDSPAPGWTGRQLRRQMYVDLRLTGNHFAAVAGARRLLTVSRLHPHRVRIDPDAAGIGGYIHDSTHRIPREDMLHVRLPSWEDTPAGLYGTGAIQSLHDDLTTDRRAARSAAQLAKRGRPDLIVSPRGDGARGWTPEFTRALKDRLDKLLDKGGTVVSTGELDVQLPTWSPRDMEFPALRQLVREAVLAVTGVPPHMVGLPSANYALAERQELVYWSMLQGFGADIEDAFYRPLAARFGPGVSVIHDWSDVDVLQAARSGRLDRVERWWMMGVPARDAAAYEGFEDAPFPAKAEAPAAPAKSLPPGDASWLDDPDVLPYTPRTFVPPTEEADRGALWRSMIRQVHRPAERRLQRDMARFLRAQAKRLGQRLADRLGKDAHVPIQRDMVDDLIESIWSQLEELGLLTEAMSAGLRLALRRAFSTAASQAGVDVTFDPVRVDELVEAAIGSEIVHVEKAAKEAARRVVHDGLAEGSTIGDMQLALAQRPEFAPYRALKIARTETTGAVTAGQRHAFRAAAEAGVSVKKGWLTSRDDVVREAHQELDGLIVDLGEEFTVPAGEFAGASAPGPGEFAEAALDVNCRCMLVPTTSTQE